MRLTFYIACLLVLGLLPPSPARPEGHGPSFALATPTLGKGGWSSDTVSMHARTSAGTASALGQMFGYGIHEDLQINFKLPIANNEAMLTANMRAGMMGAAHNFEGSLLWRFHRHAPGVGVRRESTLHLGIAYPTTGPRGCDQALR